MILPVSLLMFRLAAILENLLNLCIAVSRNSVRKPAKDLSFFPVLKYAEQWNLGEDFINWIKAENIFCSTLVDRIVTGYPRNEAAAICEELGYKDNLIDTGEIFGFWVIEGPQFQS